MARIKGEGFVPANEKRMAEAADLPKRVTGVIVADKYRERLLGTITAAASAVVI